MRRRDARGLARDALAWTRPRAVRWRRRLRWLIPLAVLAGMLAMQAAHLKWVEGLRLRAFDAFQNLAPRPYEDARVRVVDIDEESLAKLGQWPWPRTQVALLARTLVERGAAVVAFDAVFPEPDRTSPARVVRLWPDDPALADVKARVARLPDHDAALARELKKDPIVLGFAPTPSEAQKPPPQKATIGFSGATVRTVHGIQEEENPLDYLRPYTDATSNLAVLDDAAPGIGSIGFAPEHDGVIRRAPLLFRFGENLYPSLSLEALRVAQGVPDVKVKLGGTNGASWLERLLDKHSGLSKLKVGRFVVPTDGNGLVWIYYTRERLPRTLPAWKVMDRKLPIQGLQGAIVFVGTSAQGLRDLRATPLDPAEDGVQVHANLAEQMILGSYLSRPGRADRLELAATALFGAVLLLLLLRLGAAWSAPLGLGMAGAGVWLSWHAFSAWQWLIDPLFPVATLAAEYFAFAAVGFVQSERDRRRITDTFGRYLSPKVVEQLAKNPGKVELGGETREMTFHFCDIRGFTTISEKFDPHGLTAFINQFLTPMTQIILEHDGTIDKYMGDCIMAFWNAPVEVKGHASKACAAALRMHARLAELNAEWQARAEAEGKTLPRIEIGTGLNTGPCVVGNMGSSLRVDYTVLGDDVNLASRLEGQSKAYGVGVVIGPATRAQAPEFAALELDRIRVKGKTRPVTIFALLGDPGVARSPEFTRLIEAHEAFLAAYRRQDWDAAERSLAEARALGAPWKLDKLYKLFAGRLESHRAHPPAADWDGVFVATEK